MNRRMDDFGPEEIELAAELGARGAGPGRPTCPSPARLQALAADALPPEQKCAVESHVNGCPPASFSLGCPYRERWKTIAVS